MTELVTIVAVVSMTTLGVVAIVFRRGCVLALNRRGIRASLGPRQ
jgi:hypothetical protein